MLIHQAPENKDIIDCLKTAYGIKLNTLTFLPIGADMNASVYKAEAEDHVSYFVKLKHRHNHDLGISVVQLLHQAKIKEIIPPIINKSNQPTQKLNDFTLIVYPFIAGQDGFNKRLSDQQWQSLGKALRQIHDIDVPNCLKNQLRQETYTPKWRQIVSSFYDRFNASPEGDEIALKLLKFVKGHMHSIYKLVDRAEELAQIVKNESPKFVLCHSDIHGGNVLIDNNALYIVDWDDPIMAPKERDLMFIGGGVANVWNKPSEEAFFYQGYGPTEINKNLLSYYRHERIVEDIGEYAQQLLLTTSGGENRAQMYQHFIDMFKPNGVVDIAFRTEI